MASEATHSLMVETVFLSAPHSNFEAPELPRCTLNIRVAAGSEPAVYHLSIVGIQDGMCNEDRNKTASSRSFSIGHSALFRPTHSWFPSHVLDFLIVRLVSYVSLGHRVLPHRHPECCCYQEYAFGRGGCEYQ